MNIWYLKVNRMLWHDNVKDIHNFDWDLIMFNKDYSGGIFFSSSKKQKEWFDMVSKGDIVLLHSVTSGSNGKFYSDARIVGVSKIKKEKHYKKNYGLGITISKDDIKYFARPIFLKELNIKQNSVLSNAEPFSKKTRYTLTRLNNDEYAELKKVIYAAEPDNRTKLAFDYVENKTSEVQND